MTRVGDYRFPSALYYDEESHVWVAPGEDDTGRLGLDDFEQEAAGTYQRIMLKEPGEHVSRGEDFVNVESSKFVGTKASPVSGEIVDVNRAVVEEPQRINRAPYQSWLVRIALEEPAELEALVTGDGVESWIKAEIDREKERTTMLEET